MKAIDLLAAGGLLFLAHSAPLNAQMPQPISAKPTSDLNLIQAIKDYQQDYAELKIPAHALSYVDNLKQLGTIKGLQKQQSVLKTHENTLHSIERKNLNICAKIEFDVTTNEIKLGIDRAELAIQYLQSDPGTISDQGLYSANHGKQWYRYYLNAWLGAEVSPDELFKFGEKELQEAVSDYRLVQQEMGYSGDDEGLQRHLATAEKYQLKDPNEILALYHKKQNTVRGNLHKLFKTDHPVELAKIERSDRGMDFPAPGWYQRPDTFVYNVFSDSYDLRQMDWLFIHEATPGHHFQLTSDREINACDRVISNGTSAFIEGWAAYVENFGKELGLYQTPGEQLGAIEWNMIRSARVALDVAINYYGWSNDKALEYWQENVIGQDDVAMREINRMRNWPAQVITYKYGADVFKRMKQHYLAAGEEADIRDYHNIVLTYGAMPLSSFEALVVWSAEHS